MPIMAKNVRPSPSDKLAYIEQLQAGSSACKNCYVQQGINAIFPFGGKSSEEIWENSKKSILSPIHIFKTNKINYFTEKPISRILVTNIKYDTDKATYEKSPPENLQTMSVENHSHIPQNVAKTIEYTTTKSKSHSFGSSIAFGTSMKIFSKELKPGGGVKVEVNIEKSINMEFSESHGEEEVTEETDSIEIGMEVQWKSRMNVTIIAEKPGWPLLSQIALSQNYIL